MNEKGVKMQEKNVQGKKKQEKKVQGNKSQENRIQGKRVQEGKKQGSPKRENKRPESRAVKGVKPEQKQRSEQKQRTEQKQKAAKFGKPVLKQQSGQNVEKGKKNAKKSMCPVMRLAVCTLEAFDKVLGFLNHFLLFLILLHPAENSWPAEGQSDR